MTYKEFKRKIKVVYPEKQIQFIHNEVQNVAVIEGIVFVNSVYSESVYTVMGSAHSRAVAVESA